MERGIGAKLRERNPNVSPPRKPKKRHHLLEESEESRRACMLPSAPVREPVMNKENAPPAPVPETFSSATCSTTSMPPSQRFIEIPLADAHDHPVAAETNRDPSQ